MEDTVINNHGFSTRRKLKKLLREQKRRNSYQWDFQDEVGREEIHRWSQSRQHKYCGIKKTYRGILLYTFNLNTLKNFIQNINFMVIIQMVLAGFSIYVFQYFNISFDVDISLFVSPIVFPLAFSINADFQRREKVLEDLANFKSAGMLWFFCMREWKDISGLDEDWMNAVHTKLKSLLFHLREYLLTGRVDRRNVIVNAMYEDMSDCSQLTEKMRNSKLPANAALISALIHLLQMMSLSFERLRVIREYRSPRSIRSFNKVLILVLPFILGPCFVYKSLGRSDRSHSWSPYYISVLASFVFSALQGVQDTLDDPFDGMSEDDINLEQIDEWTFHSLQATVHRMFRIGRFQVQMDLPEVIVNLGAIGILPITESAEQHDSVNNVRTLVSHERGLSNSLEPSCRITCSGYSRQDSTGLTFEPKLHPYAEILENMTGSTRIEKFRGVHYLSSASSTSSLDSENNIAYSSPSNTIFRHTRL